MMPVLQFPVLARVSGQAAVVLMAQMQWGGGLQLAVGSFQLAMGSYQQAVRLKTVNCKLLIAN